ncbi:MAG TPA: hypothetical protein VGM82_03185 [Gemmatimonadaceae bacterium]|jgi:hypothetical protein
MLNRNALLLVAGAAFIAFDASSASAQARSTRRIPVSKEAPGEVAPPRVDTVTVYKTDTLRMQGRVDTLRLTNTVTRVDTVVQSVPMVMHHKGGLYFGLGGGIGLPYGSIRTVNQPGEMAQLQLGWQGINNPLGFRLDGTWNRFARNPEYGTIPFGDRSNLLGLNLDARLNLPFFNKTLGSSVRMTPYLLGGGSYIRYNNLRIKQDVDNGAACTGVGPACAQVAVDGGGSNVANDSWHGDWGFNFGGGIGFHSGKKEVFIESRGIRFNHDSNGNSPNPFKAAYQVPIIFGVNFF